MDSGSSQTVDDLLDRIAEGDADARGLLVAHMVGLANRSRREGYRQARGEMLLAINGLELEPGE